jgi:hypothetical protein
MAARVASGLRFQDLAGTAQGDFLRTLPDLLWIDRIEIALFWLGLLWLVWTVGREAIVRRADLSSEGQARTVLLAWFVIPTALLTRRTPVQPHDFNLLYPVQHLIIALFLVDATDWLGQRLDRRSALAGRSVRAAGALLVVAIVVWQVGLQQALLTFVDRHPTPGGHGAPVKYALAAARRAVDLAKREDAVLVALLPGGDPRYDGAAAAFDVLLPPEDRRLTDGRKALVLPQRTTVYLSHPRAPEAASRLTGRAEAPASPLALRPGSGESYRFFRREPDGFRLEHEVNDDSRWVLTSDRIPPPAVSLVSYAWEGQVRPGGTLRWTTSWRVEGEPPTSANLHWFNHLVDAKGARWGQRDGVGLPVSKWRDGDTVVTWFDIPISRDAPAPPYWIRTGLYAYPEIVNVPLVDPQGVPAGQLLELGPIDGD